jgi:long-chain acyl-CoA synthetase
MKGYWNKPDDTHRCFRNCYLLTGDMGRSDEAGWFYILDRKKDIINTAGWKVGPTEVERVLYEHPAVLDACVVGVPDPYRGEVVKAFIVLRDKLEDIPTEEEIISFCKERLPSYKCPRLVEFIDEMPKSEVGKPLRRLLIQRSTTVKKES